MAKCGKLWLVASTDDLMSTLGETEENERLENFREQSGELCDMPLNISWGSVEANAHSLRLVGSFTRTGRVHLRMKLCNATASRTHVSIV